MTYPPARRLRDRRGFTLVELMVVVFMIAVLMSILIPVVSGVRKRGFEVRTRSLVQKLASACQIYYSDWHSYPGVLPDSQLYGGAGAVINAPVTSTENLTLSLLGFDVSKKPSYGFWTTGPLSLNTANPKQYHAYIEYNPSEMDWKADPSMPGGGDGSYVGQYNMSSPANKDSMIPEFLDGYSDPKPILYLRAHNGATAVIDDANSDPQSANRVTQYRKMDVMIYTGLDVDAAPGDKTKPYDAPRFGQGQPLYYQSWYDAFRNEGLSPLDPNQPGVAMANTTEIAKGKDGFILIAAGSSRIWLGRDAIMVTN